MEQKRILNYTSITSILSILVSAYLLYLHYSKTTGKFCNFGENFSCDLVNKSIYSLFPPKIGIPVAFLGILFFMTILILSRMVYKNPENEKHTINYLFILSIFSLLFAVYLFSIELFVIKSFCIFCLILDVLIIINLILSYRLKTKIN